MMRCENCYGTVAEMISEKIKIIEALTKDRDEWKQQHENLLSVREADLKVLAQAQAEKAELEKQIENFKAYQAHERSLAQQKFMPEILQLQQEKEQLVRQCAEIAHEYNRSGKQAWLDKYGDVRLVDAMMTLLPKDE